MASRTNFLPRLIVIGLVGVLPAVTACGGKTVSLGNTGDSSDKLKTLDTTAAKAQAANAGACPAGFAHPNICCEAAANEDPTCGAWQNDPFRACETGWSTYPNALSCCSLSNPKDCIDTPEDAGSVALPPPPYGCGFTCPPGWYPDTGVVPTPFSGGSLTTSAPSVSCCQTLANGETECSGGGFVEPVSACASDPTTGYGGSNGAGYTDASPPPIYDGGVLDGGAAEDAGVFEDGGGYYDDGGDSDGGGFVVDAGGPYDAGTIYTCDAGDPYPIAYDGGVASLCEPCPAGWSADPNDPVLCCQVTANSVKECFSQATGSAGGGYGESDGGVSVEPADAGVVGITEPADAGVPTPSAGPFCTATLSESCECQNTTGGHTYVLDCSVDSSGKSTCFCEEDGKVTSQFSPTTATCSDLSALGSTFSASSGCGYPAP